MCLNVVTIISFLKKLTYLLYGQPTSTIDVFSNNAVMFLLNCMRLYIFPHEVFWQKGISCSSPHRHPEQTDLAVERRQPNKTNQKSVSLHVPGLSCHMKSSSTILFFFIPIYAARGKKEVIWMSAAEDSHDRETVWALQIYVWVWNPFWSF